MKTNKHATEDGRILCNELLDRNDFIVVAGDAGQRYFVFSPATQSESASKCFGLVDAVVYHRDPRTMQWERVEE